LRLFLLNSDWQKWRNTINQFPIQIGYYWVSCSHEVLGLAFLSWEVGSWFVLEPQQRLPISCYSSYRWPVYCTVMCIYYSYGTYCTYCIPYARFPLVRKETKKESYFAINWWKKKEKVRKCPGRLSQHAIIPAFFSIIRTVFQESGFSLSSKGEGKKRLVIATTKWRKK
jgi:hypothetical protein